MELYFAYGSNLSLEQMRRRCPESSLLDVARIFRYRLAFSIYSNRWGGGVATMLPANNAVVWGLVYSLSKRDLELLDGFEGKKYSREKIKVQLKDGRALNAWTYFVDRPQAFIPPTEEYIGIIRGSAKLFNFPRWYLEMLYSVPSSTNTYKEAAEQIAS